jgi:hypothetical protein
MGNSNPDRTENKRSEVGRAKASGHPEKVSSIERVGSPGGKGGQTFRMPKDSEVCDHSKIKSLK